MLGRKNYEPRAGTTQELDESLLPHSIFIGFAPAEAPVISTVVLVEHGESGGRVAAPIARQIMEFYHKNIESLELPRDFKAKSGAGDGDNARKARFRRRLRDAFGEADRAENPRRPRGW